MNGALPPAVLVEKLKHCVLPDNPSAPRKTMAVAIRATVRRIDMDGRRLSRVVHSRIERAAGRDRVVVLCLNEDNRRIGMPNGIKHQTLQSRRQVPALGTARGIDSGAIAAIFVSQDGFDAPESVFPAEGNETVSAALAGRTSFASAIMPPTTRPLIIKRRLIDCFSPFRL